MAARIRKGTKDNPWPDNVRAKIRTSMLIKRLEDHALGLVQMSATQVSAALGVARKSLPDLTATELSGAVERTTVIRVPEKPKGSKAWLDKYGPERSSPDPKPDQVN